jgi:hypothetical protein
MSSPVAGERAARRSCGHETPTRTAGKPSVIDDRSTIDDSRLSGKWPDLGQTSEIRTKTGQTIV